MNQQNDIGQIPLGHDCEAVWKAEPTIATLSIIEGGQRWDCPLWVQENGEDLSRIDTFIEELQRMRSAIVMMQNS